MKSMRCQSDIPLNKHHHNIFVINFDDVVMILNRYHNNIVTKIDIGMI
jgi:hypothetical protein